MGDYEEKQRKEREALDLKFKTAAAPLAELIAERMEKVSGKKPQRSVHDGSHAISFYLDEPRITVEIEHDWGPKTNHWTRLPLGTPKINLDVGGYRGSGKSHYRPDKEGKFNVDKIIEKIKERVESHRINQEASKKIEIENKANSEAQAKEMEGVVFPEGALAQRSPGGSYAIKFGGTFLLDGATETKELATALQALVAKFRFQKAWRTDF